MNLILLEPREVGADGTAVLSGDHAEHVQGVLNAVPGRRIRVGLRNGPLGEAVVNRISPGQVEVQCAFEPDPPPVSRVDLLLALPRPKVLRRLWAQLAALGVGQIVLTNAARVERDYFDTHVLAPDTYEPLLVEGLQQARDTRVPAVSIHRQFRVLVEDWLDELFPRGLRLAAEPGAGVSFGETLRTRVAHRVLVAIGPEGGWNEFELGLLGAHGFLTASCGPRTLRSDTACVAILAIAHEALRAQVKGPTP